MRDAACETTSRTRRYTPVRISAVAVRSWGWKLAPLTSRLHPAALTSPSLACTAGALEAFQTAKPLVVLLDMGLPPRPADPEEGLATLAELLALATRVEGIVRNIGMHAGGVLIAGAGGTVIGAVGVTGDLSDNDELCALAGIEAAEYGAAPP